MRDVVAHLAATAELSRLGFIREFVRAQFSVDRIVERQLDRARQRDASASLTALRSAVNRTVSLPLPLITRVIEIVVHGEDIRRPLGIHHVYPTTWTVEAVRYLYGDRASGGKALLRGLTLSATDIDFAVGRGPLVEGPAVALCLAASGRAESLDQLSGPGTGRLVSRLLNR